MPPTKTSATLHELDRQLSGMEGSSYGRYRSLQGRWQAEGFEVEIRKVQSDPFAPPSRIAVRVPRETAQFPEDLWHSQVRATALSGYLLRQLREALRGSGIFVDAGGQEVLQRSSCQIHNGAITVQLGLNLPGHGRRIDARGARRALCQQLPEAVRTALLHPALPATRVERFVDSVEDTDAARAQLPDHDLVAFVADGAMLARRSGVDNRPLTDGVAFDSPASMRVSLELPNRGTVTGMGVPTGITLIVGGGFHGKSTLLRALERGVYDHVPGDGRELVVTRHDAVKIRAEDGRSVERSDVSAFVSHLPTGADTTRFSTENASGSTSQAASTVEAIEAGAGALLIDEDTSATNMMIRDGRMQALVAKDKEPLTPFLDRIRPLHADRGVSVILAMGGSGDYLDVADRVVMMDAYVPHDVTGRAMELRSTGHREVEAEGFPPLADRVCDPRSVDSTAKGKRRIKGRGTDALTFGDNDIDLQALEQLVDRSQVIGIGLALEHCVSRGLLDGKRTVPEVLAALDEDLSAGVDAIGGGYLGDFALPRRFEVAAALSRLRGLRVLPG